MDWQSRGGNGRYCTFGPCVRTVIHEFSDFGVLWQYRAYMYRCDEKYTFWGCVCGAQPKGGNGRCCTFGPRARIVIYEFSDFGVLWQYAAVRVQM